MDEIVIKYMKYFVFLLYYTRRNNDVKINHMKNWHSYAVNRFPGTAKFKNDKYFTAEFCN